MPADTDWPRILEFDHESRTRQVKRLLSQARVVTIDLTNLTMMDSMGLGTIAALYASSRSGGRDLHVVNIGPRIREMFRVSRLLLLFESAGGANVRIP